MSTWAIVVAAGKGTRANMGKNKVFCPYRGRTVLERTLTGVRETGLFDGIVVVLSADDIPEFQKLGYHADRIALGGDTRQQSVFNGISALPQDADIVAVHDAARPFASREIFAETIASAKQYGSGVISTPVTDTVKEIDPETGAVRTLDRSRLRAVQTPQTFSRAKLEEAHIWAKEHGISATDDAALYERYWHDIRLVTAEGGERNKKLTLREDFQTMNAFRIGTGYDAHRLKEGRRLILCGVEIPYNRGLDGHSDADVAVHALMDAMLGALALGDIGKLFPDKDPAYEGISSILLLKEVCRRIREKGYAVGNADITIVAQKPKLAGYIGQMRKIVAEALEADEDCVSVKATTTEHMGFEGEEIGISSQAVVLLQKI